MKHIIAITASTIALSAIAFTTTSAVLKHKAKRKPSMTFIELFRDNSAADLEL